MTTEPLPEAAKADHLTDTLRRAGVLGDCRVRAAEIVSTPERGNKSPVKSRCRTA